MRGIHQAWLRCLGPMLRGPAQASKVGSYSLGVVFSHKASVEAVYLAVLDTGESSRGRALLQRARLSRLLELYSSHIAKCRSQKLLEPEGGLSAPEEGPLHPPSARNDATRMFVIH